ncbi:MAG TPA: M1 family metallopeptidase [Holophagaceae bacterium]|nr:M1 family metallopeptidase [Holophagaceae bacterium]
MGFRRLRLVSAALLGVAMGAALGARTPDHWFDKPLSPRIVSYRIQAKLDWPEKALAGTETLSWRNPGSIAVSEVPLHLYLNAFKGPSSIYMKESGGHERGDAMGPERQPGSWGYCQLLSVKLDGRPLEGHAGEDETVWWVKLPRPVAPGETIALDIAWNSRFPRVFARSGWAGGDSPAHSSFLMGAQWFPKIGVLQGSTWHCDAYHGNTEFFSDFGVYDVEINAPIGMRFASVGTGIDYKDPKSREPNDVWPDPSDPKREIFKAHAEDVHDFSFAAKFALAWNLEVETYRGVEVRYYYENEDVNMLPRLKKAVEAGLRWSGQWFFPYPYPVLTVVAPPSDASGADGMEYPTLITAGTPSFDPLGERVEPEVTAIHEFGHQYFYGMLASNEVDEAWLDEGMNSWFTARAMDQTYHALVDSRRLYVPTDFLEWSGYWNNPSSDPLSRKGYQTETGNSYYVIAYAKPTMVLNQLEAMLGKPVMDDVMRAYAKEMAFKHVTRGDFKRVAERVSGRDLTKFWQDFVEGTGVLDYRIARVGAADVTEGGWMEKDGKMVFAAPQPASPGRTGSITLERRGDIREPITLWVRLENNDERRLQWDGQDRWITYRFDSPVKAAMLDPDGNYPMLKDRLHASYTQAPSRRGFQYWSQLVWGGLAGLLQSAGLG